jgi:probable F420-dependent oxidoreductase
MTLDVGPIGIWSPSPPWQADAHQSADTIAELEELGYGALWMGSPPSGDLTLQQSLLAASEEIVVATGIVNVWTEPAALVTASYHRIQAAHPDRFLLGLGPSHAALVGEHYARPLSRLRSYLDELDALEQPVPRDRRVLAALGPKALALAAERSAGAHPYLVSPDYTRSARELLGPGPLLAVEQKILLETDRGRARELAQPRLDPYLGLPNYTNNLLRHGFTEEDLADGGSERLFDGLIAWGDPETVAARVREHHAAGADHVCIQVIDAGDTLPLEQWRRLAPALIG